MKKIILSTILVSSLFASENIPNEKCKSCHNLIYSEFTSSTHYNSTIDKDKIHSGMWKLQNSDNTKDYDKSCGKCHNPTNEPKEAISCAYCHTIESVKHNKQSNDAIMLNDAKSYYGNREDNSKSPFHKIVTTNENYKNGNICLSCHSHLENSNNIVMCKTDNQNTSKQNCITCHMPQVQGTRADDIITQTHSFHGFAGVSSNNQMLSKYIDLNTTIVNNTLKVVVQNNSPHSLFIHPLRVGVIEVTLIKDGAKTKLSQEFGKVFGKDDNTPTIPSNSTKVLKDTTIVANKSSEFVFENINTDGEIKVTLGYYLVNPKMLEKLELQKDYKSVKFYKLKEIDVK